MRAEHGFRVTGGVDARQDKARQTRRPRRGRFTTRGKSCGGGAVPSQKPNAYWDARARAPRDAARAAAHWLPAPAKPRQESSRTRPSLLRALANAVCDSALRTAWHRDRGLTARLTGYLHGRSVTPDVDRQLRGALRVVLVRHPGFC